MLVVAAAEVRVATDFLPHDCSLLIAYLKQMASVLVLKTSATLMKDVTVACCRLSGLLESQNETLEDAHLRLIKALNPKSISIGWPWYPKAFAYLIETRIVTAFRNSKLPINDSSSLKVIERATKLESLTLQCGNNALFFKSFVEICHLIRNLRTLHIETAEFQELEEIFDRYCCELPNLTTMKVEPSVNAKTYHIILRKCLSLRSFATVRVGVDVAEELFALESGSTQRAPNFNIVSLSLVFTEFDIIDLALIAERLRSLYPNLKFLTMEMISSDEQVIAFSQKISKSQWKRVFALLAGRPRELQAVTLNIKVLSENGKDVESFFANRE
ncbi:hypothetical protein HDU76_006132 [Blyttiomyces sp. JEL0837]|nr:hypothetical protein HDU76_006132 [Blyttiomyces sp. JEL0837]